MKAVFLQQGQVQVKQVRPPKCPSGWAVIQPTLLGICNTDLELQRGYYGFSGIPGHEFVGTVVECADSTWIGKRVVGEINISCQDCDWCRGDLGRHCPKRRVLGIVRQSGAFQERFVLPVRNLWRVPASVSDEAAVFTEPLAAACQILEQVRLRSTDRVAVLGDGKLGLLIARVLYQEAQRFQKKPRKKPCPTCPEVVHLGRHRAKLQLSKEQGISTRILPETLPKSLLAAFDLVVDATGSSSGLSLAISMTKPRGTVVMKSTVHASVAISTAAAIVNEIQMLGSRCGRFGPALKLLREQTVDPLGLIEAIYPLSEASAAFAHAAKKGSRKILMRVG
jgi:threonine dehydrogenase-like Zn-dependent dehydrogenase